MVNIRLTTAVFAAAVGIVAVAPRAKADDWDHKTIVTTSASLNVAGTVLEPGKYVFQLLYTAPYEHVVQILNVRENHLITTVMAHPVGYMEQGIPARLQGAEAGKAHFTFWETPAGEPKALRDWYYQGAFQGEEFPYHKMAVTQVAQVTQTTPEPQAEAPAPPAEVAQNTPPPPPAETPAPAPEAAPALQPEAPAVAENPTPRTIPQTSSNIPLLALFGFGSIGLAIGVGVFAKRMG
ncbi:MAG: hypothetical protein ABSG41_10650 [Bryobacteraceae bacterium]|jgi:hypothetical protein